MIQQKVTFFKFCLIEFLFQINNRVFNRFLCLDILFISDVFDRLTILCFNKILGYFYLFRALVHGNTVNISYSAAELYYSNILSLPLIFTICRIFFHILKNSSYVAIIPWSSLLLFPVLKNAITIFRKEIIECQLRVKLM